MESIAREGMTGFDVAAEISQEMKKQALVARVNGEVVELWRPLHEGDRVEILTFEDEDGRRAYRHTASHILAQAVQAVRPGTRLAIGPAIENGFYYDFDSDEPFTPADLAAIEKEMGRIIKRNEKLERFELPREEALALMREKNEPYKVELIEDLPEDAAISFYRQGDFTDLCAGPHLPSTGRVKAVKLTHVAGAYWRGSEKNKMLQRVYGTAFPTREQLDAYLARIEEAKRRDHRKLGRELDLFAFMDEGPGFPFFLPKGMVLKNTLVDYWRDVHRRYGYVEISTPVILSRALWETSGHWFHYKDNMYTTVIDDEDFAIKPMNCPGGMLVYRTKMHSYRDLPMRVGELGLVHRHELSGALHGLFRVRCFTQDDAHIFMTWDQMKDEIKGTVRLFDEVYSTFGLTYQIELSTMPEDHMGDEKDWDFATRTLGEAIEEMGKAYAVNEGDGAFYGPKLDFHLADSLGRTWQCGTIQLDLQLPERFALEYVGADGEKHRPVMIHRVVFGSIERFIGILTEHFAGAFPLWISPVQVKVLTITERGDARAQEILAALEALGVRAEADLRNEKIGFKIRQAQMEKVPYMLVIGDKEVDSGEVAVRGRKGDLGVMTLDAFTDRLTEEIRTRAL
ncbi:MAG TPA: threonine--tRNA ligase [Candidatus Avichristensenella intestinipullorum]|uniref:Threonine--tRNA ligase n=1 Tax=Candidatus Avichristensenella intestinipullorum TaxID=2840693 RepID=A0A9D0YXD1_9FIRM|nr:threonine--tRNA ligase [Candidatus Avichristensenella intestinipullorum]